MLQAFQLAQTAGIIATRYGLSFTNPTVVIATDCEPDDELALGVLRARGFTNVSGVVVGEGCVGSKMRRATQYVSQLNWNKAIVLPGLPSEKLFPGETAASATSHPESAHTATATATDASAAFSVDDFLATMEAAADEPTLVCLKPPREILAALREQPERARAAFARTTLAAYGSFNFRTLGYSATVPLIASETTPFKRVYYLESHGNGVPNLNPSTAPALPTWLTRQWPDFAAGLRATCAAWDADILRDCDESCAEEEAKERAAGLAEHTDRWKRNNKCRLAVQANQGQQFVPADPVLALVLHNDAFPAQPMRIVHSGNDAQYPTISLLSAEEAAASSWKTYTWKGLEGATVIEALDKLLE
jgi:hypothetical protein